MRIRFSKSVRLGKGSRVTFSRSGISTSTKVGPFRIGANTRGRSWLSVAKGGFSARRISGRQKSPASLPPATPIPSQGATSQIAPLPTISFHQYSGREVLAITGMNVLLILTIGIAPTIGSVVLVAVIATVIYALAIDMAGVGTLRGAIRWASMSSGGKTWAIIGWIFLYPFYWWYYCGRIVYEWYTERQLLPQHRRQDIAQLEAHLGMLPAIDGICNHCHKPLTANATFCTYCGQQVQTKAKVCSVCATLAPPDGQFCPGCRAPLT